MFISYDAVVHVVGPAENIRLFVQKVKALQHRQNSTGIEQTQDDAQHAVFSESTYDVPLDDSHNLPVLVELAMAEPMAVEGVTIRTVLCSDSTKAIETVIENNKIVFMRRFGLGMNSPVAGGEEPPVVALESLGKQDAWAQACARFNVIQN